MHLFFFQAEDGIRDYKVTGVQTCALPIYIDHVGVEGLELMCDEELRGHPGWTTLFRDGRGRSHQLQRGQERRPEDGHQVVLTLDADLQAIVEHHLAEAVDTLRAARGFALFLDPRSGEILASANVPHLPPGRARNWT